MKVLILLSMPLASLVTLNPYNHRAEPEPIPKPQTLELDLIYQDLTPRTLELDLMDPNYQPKAILLAMDPMDQEPPKLPGILAKIEAAMMEPPAPTVKDLMDQELQIMLARMETMKFEMKDCLVREAMTPTIRIPTPKKIRIPTRLVWKKKKQRQRRIRFLT